MSESHVVTYRYGLLAPLESGDHAWGEDCEDQLRKQTAFWNILVEIERAYVEAVRAVGLAGNTATARREAAETRVRELREQIKARNIARRSVKPPDHLEDQLKVAQEELRRAREAEKVERKRLYEQSDAALRKIADDRIAQAKTARQAANADGLWWCNANAVVDSFETGRKAARRMNGEMRFHRHDGSGRLTNQIINGMTVDELFGGAHSQVRIGPAPAGMHDRGGAMARKGRRVLTLTATVYARGRAERRLVTWPLIMHRPLPPGSRIQMVTVLRVKRATGWAWYVTITVRTAVVPVSDQKSVAAVNLGWRATASGLRVATVLCRAHAGTDDTAHVFLPERLIEGASRAEESRSRRDAMVNLAWQAVSALPRAGMPEALGEVIRVASMRRPVRARHLVAVLRAWPADWEVEERRALESVLRRDRSAWWVDAHRRNWLRDARRAHYEAEALRLVGDCGTILINQHDMSETARAEDSALPASARHNRVLAAPHLLRSAISNLARRKGIRLVMVNRPNDRCWRCENPLIPNDRSQLFWMCPQCRHAEDQDVNYVRLMLSGGGDGESAEGARNGEIPDGSTAKKKGGRINRKRPRNDPDDNEGRSQTGLQATGNTR